MIKIILTTLILNTFILANINIAVSIMPEKSFVEAIGGDKVNVSLMVLPGNSPHTYEPKPSQMKDIAKASLYFAIGVEFEKIWLNKFKHSNKNMKTIELSKGIKKLSLSSSHNSHHNNHTTAYDPHIWTSPNNVKIIALKIYDTLVKEDSNNKKYYEKNYEKFLEVIESTDNKIKSILSNKNGAKFMVFHPSWGYFAKDYNLEQMPIELEGKSPKPRELIELIKKAKNEQISAIFTQPEFSDSVAKVMANELGIKVIKVSPLAKNWSENLLYIANSIANKD